MPKKSSVTTKNENSNLPNIKIIFNFSLKIIFDYLHACQILLILVWEIDMRSSWNEIRVRASNFASRWLGQDYEKSQTQSFYQEFFGIFDISFRKVGSFEQQVNLLSGKTGYIDLFWKGNLLVEQKSAGKSLVNAKAQALDYFASLKDYELPRYILLCDFQNFELYDLDDNLEVKFKLSDLPRVRGEFCFHYGRSETNI